MKRAIHNIRLRVSQTGINIGPFVALMIVLMFALYIFLFVALSFTGINGISQIFLKSGYQESPTLYFYTGTYSVNAQADFAVDLQLNSSNGNVGNFLPNSAIEENVTIFFFNMTLANTTKAIFFGFQDQLNYNGINGYAGLPFSTFPLLQSNAEKTIWSLTKYEIKFGAEGSYQPIVVLYLNNGSYVQPTQHFSNFQLSVQPISALVTQEISNVNLFLTLAIVFVGALEIGSFVADLVPKIFTKRKENASSLSYY
jgi:hypothetical protein